jgi:GlpG protein
MRSIGRLDNETLAARFGDHLYVQGIENQIEDEDGGDFSIWVIEDEKVAQAAALLERFRVSPDSPEFVTASSAASRRRESEARADKNRRATVADAERVTYEKRQVGFAWLPIMLIVISGAVAIYSNVGANTKVLLPFFISNDVSSAVVPPEVAVGQVWRLITPMFIHFGWIHLLFNTFWLHDLGKFLEERFGALYLGVFIVACAILSNLTQYWWNGPFFGGMSGVNYALFGFLWIRGKYDRRAQWQLDPSTVQVMLAWFVICLTGMLGPVANGAHFGGLVAGAAWGWLSSGKLNFSR